MAGAILAAGTRADAPGSVRVGLSVAAGMRIIPTVHTGRAAPGLLDWRRMPGNDLFSLLRDTDDDAARMPDIGAGPLACLCAAMPGRAGPNEDAVGVFPLPGGAVVLAVADGMGGGPSGARAAGAVVASLADALATPAAADPPHDSSAPPGGHADTLRSVVITALEAANRTILGWGIGACTTVTAAIITPAGYRTVHAGDSAAVVTGQRGVVKHLTVAHSPVGFGQAAGMLNETDAMDHDERHVVSNVLGMDTLSLEVSSPRRFAAKDTLVIASDGLFDNLPLREVIELARRGPVGRVADALRIRAQAVMAAGGKPDDLGLIVFRPAAASPAHPKT